MSTVKEAGWTVRRCTCGFRGQLLGRDVAEQLFTSLKAASGSTLPAITRIALLGAYQVSWKLLSIAAVVFSKEGRVPSASCA